MAGQPRPDGSSPLDKLSKDVSQYRQTQAAGKHPAKRVVVRAARAQADERPAWTELDSNLSSQILVGLLITGYAILMLAATLGVIALQPAASIVLWPVMAIGVLAAMVAHHKGRPPLLWFMYGSIVPMAPLGHAVLMSKAGSSLGGLQGLLAGSGQGSSGSVLDLLVCVCVLGAIPLVHAALVPQDLSVLEARQTAGGLRKCPFCSEMVKQDARLCRYCGKDVPHP